MISLWKIMLEKKKKISKANIARSPTLQSSTYGFYDVDVSLG